MLKKTSPVLVDAYTPRVMGMKKRSVATIEKHKFLLKRPSISQEIKISTNIIIGRDVHKR